VVRSTRQERTESDSLLNVVERKLVNGSLTAPCALHSNGCVNQPTHEDHFRPEKSRTRCECRSRAPYFTCSTRRP